jgi:TonB family protein
MGFSPGGIVSFGSRPRWLATGLLALAACLSADRPAQGFAQKPEGEITRKIKVKVAPVYPEIARRLSISGVVRLVVVVAPGGNVKSTKVLGGHPVLVNAAEDAVKKWKFETATEENSGVVEVTFKPDGQ